MLPRNAEATRDAESETAAAAAERAAARARPQIHGCNGCCDTRLWRTGRRL